MEFRVKFDKNSSDQLFIARYKLFIKKDKNMGCRRFQA